MKHSIVPTMSAAALLLAASGSSLAAAIDPADKYAWSESSGWVNHRANHGETLVFDDHLEGHAWAENIGWVKLGSYSGGGAHSYANGSASDWGVNHDGAGNLSGYGWSETAGWINFNPSHGQVTIDPATGDFDGYAWAENLGWVHFQNASPAYKVSRATVPDTAPPTVTIGLAPGQANPASGEPIVFQVTFSEPVTGFDVGDLTLGGSAGPTSATIAGSGASYTVEVGGFAGPGTVTLTVNADGAQDSAGNGNTASDAAAEATFTPLAVAAEATPIPALHPLALGLLGMLLGFFGWRKKRVSATSAAPANDHEVVRHPGK